MSDEELKSPDPLDESITHTLIGRLRNPFFGSFALSWIVIHWEAVYVTLVGSVPTSCIGCNRIDYVKTLGYGWGLNFWLPTLLGGLLPVLLKYVGGFVHVELERGEKWLNARRRKINEGAFVPIAEKEHYVKLFHQVDRENAELREKLEPLYRQLGENRETIKGVREGASNLLKEKNDLTALVDVLTKRENSLDTLLSDAFIEVRRLRPPNDTAFQSKVKHLEERFRQRVVFARLPPEE